MIEKNPNSFSDIVDRAMEELRLTLVPPGPPPELLEALLQAAKANEGAMQPSVKATAALPAKPKSARHLLSPINFNHWRWIMRSPISRAATAAIFLIAVAGVALWFYGGGARVTFADVVEKFLEVKNYRCKITDDMGDSAPSISQEMWIAPNRTRTEHLDEKDNVDCIEIEDRSTKDILSLRLDPNEKRAEPFHVLDFPRSEPFIDEMREMFSEAKKKNNKDVTSLGEKNIDGHRVVGYRVKDKNKFAPGTIEIWADVETLLPVLIVYTNEIPEKMRETLPPNEQGKKGEPLVWVKTASDFHYNEKVDESLFSLTPPADYTVEKEFILSYPEVQKKGAIKEDKPK